jgi:hypothetical protein
VSRPLPLLTLSLVLGVSACGGGGSSTGNSAFGATPLTSFQVEGGPLNVALYTSPQPPVRGDLSIRYVVTDPQGSPVNGLTLSLTPWMVTMGHGTSVTPSVRALDHGVYEFTNVYVFMPGPWELRTTFSGSVSGGASPLVQVE